MTSQLAKQLQQLQTRPDGDQHLAKSFLFSNSDAKQISREQIHDLATAGLRTLLAIDNRFAPFLEPLFGQSTIRRERSMFTTEQNLDISDKIKNVCALLSPHLFVMAAQQVFEYLIRVYEVHTYDVRTVISMFLPYHDHAIFGRVVMLLDLRSTGFDFLKQNQESGTVLPRVSLITAAAENAKVMRLICEIAADAVRYEVPNNAAFALLAGVATATASRAENDAVLRVLLPFLVNFLEEPHAIATPTAILIMCVWCQEGAMTPKALAAIVRPLIASLNLSQYPVSLSERLAALGHVFKFQGTAVHDVAFSPILEMMLALPSWQDWWTSKSIPQTATNALTHRLLDYCLVQLRTAPAAVSASSDVIQFLCAASNFMGGLSKKDIVAIFGCFVTFLSVRAAAAKLSAAGAAPNKKKGAVAKAAAAAEDEVSELISACLKGLERRFPLFMDETISEALGKAMTGGATAAAADANAPSYESLIHFISVHFSGTKYEMIDIPISSSSASSSSSGAVETRKAPLLTCLLHQVAEVRRLAFVALRHRVETASDAATSASLVDEVVLASSSSASQKGNLLPLIRHAIEVETSSIVAAEAIAFARALISAAMAAAAASSEEGSSASASIATILGALWTMLSASVGDELSFADAASPTAAFVAILSEVIAAEQKKASSAVAGTPAKKAPKRKLGGKAPTGITAAGAADEDDNAADSTTACVSSSAASPLLSRALYLLTVVACTETGTAGTTATLEGLFAKLGLAAPAGGFVVAASSSSAAPSAVEKKKTVASDSDSDDEERKKPKKKIGEAPSSSSSSSAAAKKGSSSSFATAELATSFCPESIFAVSAADVAKKIFGAIAANFAVADLAATAAAWAAKKPLLGVSEDDYAAYNVAGKDAINRNMLSAHIAEAAVMAAVATFAASTVAAEETNANTAAFAVLSQIVDVASVSNTSITINAVPSVAVGLGLRGGLFAALLSGNVAAAAASVLAKVLALLVVRFKQALPSLSLIPANALWGLSSLSTAATTDAAAGGVIRVSVEMAAGASRFGLLANAAGPAKRSEVYAVRDEIRMQDDRSAELFAAIADAVYGNSPNANTAAVCRDAIAFALLIPTMAPSAALRQRAVETLQTTVLSAVAAGGSGKKGAAADASSFIASAITQLTASASLSVTSVNSLVEVLAQSAAVKNTACLTEDMAKAVLRLLLVDASDAASSSSVALSPAYVSNAITALFAHNKRSAQKHGELILSQLLPIFIRPTIAKAATMPLSAGEAQLLFTAASLVNFAGVTSVSSAAPLEATCEVAALCLKRGGVRIFAEKKKNANILTSEKKSDELEIRSLFVPILAALTATSTKLLAAVANKGAAIAGTNLHLVLTPSRLLIELLVPLYERSGAVSSDLNDTTTAAQHVVAFLTTTAFGFNMILTPVLPSVIMHLGSAVDADGHLLEDSAAAAEGSSNTPSRKAGKKAAAEGTVEKNAAAATATTGNFAQLVDLATEVVAFLGTAASGEATDATKAGAMMADGAASSVLKQITASSGIVASHNVVLDAATVARLFRAATTALESLPMNAADVAASSESPAAIVTTKVNLLKFIAILVQSAPSADGFVRENTHGKSLDRMLIAVDASEANDDDGAADNDDAADATTAAASSSAVSEKETALAYILRSFEMNALTPFLLGQGAEGADDAAAAAHSVTLGGVHNISAASGSVALTLSSMRAIQMLISTVHNNSVALTAGKKAAHHERTITEGKHHLVRQSLMLLSSLFVAEGSDGAASSSSANVLVAVVSQLLHVIGPLLSGAHAGSSAASTEASKKAAASATLGAATSLLHIPLMALYLRLDAAAAARQAALAAEDSSKPVASALLADGGADYFVSATLLETPVDICAKILTSFAIEEQMAALCGLMELVCDPNAHLVRVAAAAASDNEAASKAAAAAGSKKAGKSLVNAAGHADIVTELCARLIRTGRIVNRQEPILTLIALVIKSDHFLAPFVQLQFNDAKLRALANKGIKEKDAREKEETVADAVAAANNTNIDNSTNCANLLVASLNLFSHYHSINAKTLAAAKERRLAKQNADDVADLSDVDDEEDDIFTEEKAYTTLLELLAGNCLACVLAAINEPTFVDCQKRMLTSTNPALRQKGLETLLDRLHQSLPTAEDDALATTTNAALSAKDAAAAAKEARDPRSKAHYLDTLQLKARPQTTRLSAELLPLLTSILQSSLSTEGLFSLNPPSTAVVAAPVAAPAADSILAAPVSKKDKKKEKKAAAAAEANAPTQEQQLAAVQVSIACVEELTRIIGSGGSQKADKTLSKPQQLGGGSSTTTITEATLISMFKNKSRINDLHTIANLCLKALNEWGTALTIARRGLAVKFYSKAQQVLVTALVSPARSLAQQKAVLQSMLVLSGACFNLMATIARTLSVVFTAPHSNDILKSISTWMSVVMHITTTNGGVALPANSNKAAEKSTVAPSIENIFVNTQLNAQSVSAATMNLFSNFKNSSEAVPYLRKVLLHSIHFTLPSTWMMAHPYIPTFVSFATHNCNVNDHETTETSASFLSSLRAVLGDRGLLECICSALTNTSTTGASATEVIVPVTPLTHSMRLIFIFVERILNEMTKEEVATMPILITGSGAEEGGIASSAAAAGKNFWLTALGALAGQGTSVPAVDAMEPVFDAYLAFFIKFKERTCAQFWTKITDWAVNRAGAGAANASAAAAADKRRRTEGGADRADGGAHDDDANADEEGGYTRKQVAVHFVYLSLYNHLLRRLKSIMTFSFPIVSNVMVELLQRYNPTPFVNFSTAASASDKKMAALLGNSTASDNTGGQWILKNKGMGGVVFSTTTALMMAIQLMSDAQIPEDVTLAARTGVAHDVFFAKVDVFNTFMPLIFSMLSNTQVFSFDSSVGVELTSLGYYKRAERFIVPSLRKYFACLNGPKLWSLAQKELIKYLRHPKAAVRKATLLIMQLCYRDGGDVLCSFIMAEGLPAIVEMTEDNDKEVVEQARLLCNELSTITGQDVLHAMA